MKVDIQYNDFKEAVASDISDFLGVSGSDGLKTVGIFFGLNQYRLEIIGLSFSGQLTSTFHLFAVTKKEIRKTKDHVVKMFVETDNGSEVLDILFKTTSHCYTRKI